MANRIWVVGDDALKFLETDSNNYVDVYDRSLDFFLLAFDEALGVASVVLPLSE
jgi:hypothetical protein